MTSVLLLAGTTEATRLAKLLVDQHGVDVLSSLAGRTNAPAARAGRTRIGGFGGVEGLTRFLREQRMDALIDATHPFAAVMPFNAAAAAAATGTPSCRLLRPPWKPGPADRWVEVPDLTTAVEQLDRLASRRVLLTVGRQSTREFAGHDAWFLIRSIEPPSVTPRHCRLVLDRGPFEVASERALLIENRIDTVVTKNSGGAATAAKLLAARELGIPVIVVARPVQPPVPVVSDLDHAVAWLRSVVGPGCCTPV